MATQSYLIKSGDDIFTISNNTLNSLDKLYTILIANEIDINTDIETIATKKLTYDSIYITTTKPAIKTKNPSTSTIILFNTNDGQTIYDTCLQSLGTLDNLVQFLVNNDIETIDNVEVGLRTLIFDYKKVSNYGVYNNLINNNIKYITLSAELITTSIAYLLQSEGYVLLSYGEKIIIKY